ncbi:hypothetical protein AB0I49_04740 [Streptomyces sp. NPDC050617]|uniref:hypothetical protein n=1 Tax=Streptomyces sp. NPDC050617 TaxID=3154628 RepID=UPI00341EED46
MSEEESPMSHSPYGPPKELLQASTGSYGMVCEARPRVPVYVSGLLKFPLADEDFTGTYGKIEDTVEHKKLVSAVKDAQKILTAYGDPITVNKKLGDDGDYLTKSNAPSEFYAQELWSAHGAKSAASTFSSRAQKLWSLLEKSPKDIKKNAALVRDVFTGSGGLTSLCAEQKKRCDVLRSTAEKTAAAFEGVKESLTECMGKDSKTYASAKATRKAYESQATAFDGAAAAAWTEWLEYRGAQAAQPLDVAVVNCGVPAGVAELGGQAPETQAVTARKAYKALLDAVNEADEEVQHKACLASDLAGFDRQLKALPAALTEMRERAANMSAAWEAVSAGLTSAAALSDDVLGDPTKLNDTLDFNAGAQKWSKLATAAEQFTAKALVAPTFTPWGLPLDIT